MSASGEVTDNPQPTTLPNRGPVSAPSRSLYRVFWRWHFYAGVLVTPVLLVVTITGGMYVFKDEIERILYPSVLVVEPGTSRVPLEDQIAAAKASVPEGYRAGSISVPSDPNRPTEVFFQAKDQPFKQVYVDPYTGEVRGELSGDRFFRTVLKLHRSLFAGVAGRVLVELVTSWTIILLVTGLYLWWPRKGSIAGVLYPRLWAKPYTVLRDLHTVVGFYLLPATLVIVITGLVYTQVWGSGYHLAADKTGAFAEFRNPPKSTSPPGATPLPLDEAYAVARARYPDANSLSLTLPSKPDGALVFFVGSETGPTTQGTLALDRSTGEVLVDTPVEQQPALRWWSSWNYPLHVGSVLGAPTKILWLIACLVLAALPVTGVWMWWKRRPVGKTGFPRRPDTRVPWWLIGVIALLGILLPVVGASMLAILLGEWVVRLIRRFTRPKPQAV